MIICQVTHRACVRECEAVGKCKLMNLSVDPAQDHRHEDRRKEIAAKESYFIDSHRLGAIEQVATAMLASASKRHRRVELNHIQHVLKTLKLIPHSAKVISIGLGCLDTGESGLLVLCTSPIQVQGDIPDATRS